MVGGAPLACVTPLFVPADRPERFSKAAASGADAVFIDLEDAVAPDAKARARNGLRDLRLLAVPTFVRVNAPATSWYADDIAVVRALPIAGIILPKVESAEHICAARGRLAAHHVIVALIETAAGLANARQIARADEAMRLAFGSIDYCADMACAHTREALLFARTEIVLASRLGRLAPPLDGVTAEIGNPSLIESDARHAAELGFAGKLCIHPRQIEPVYASFAPTDTELAWARRVLSVADAGAVSLDGEMIDAPVRRRAEALLARGGRS